MTCPRCSYSWVPRVECPKCCPHCNCRLTKPRASATVSGPRLRAIAQFCADNNRSDFANDINKLTKEKAL